MSRRIARMCPGLIFLACLWATPMLSIAPGTVEGIDDTPKLLYLLIEEDRLIASNVNLRRFDELKLTAEEVILKKAVADGVAVVVTNKRFIAYGAVSGTWRTLRYQAGEKLMELEAEDFSILVVTSERILIFNGQDGIWAETRR